MRPNVNRFHRARRALEAYEQELRAVLQPNPDELVIDLLTDLRHYCAFEKLDFDEAFRISAMHFDEESK